jgi:indole-3-glycerol phosphate synthase
MSILDKIAAYKREEVATAKARTPLRDLEARIAETATPRGFRARLVEKKSEGEFGLVGEIKKASPSKGVIRPDFNPLALAQGYESGGTTCLSVLTDAPSFQGCLDYLPLVHAAVGLPVLRKDFLLDVYQVAEARAYAADCVLIILAMIDDDLASDLLGAAGQYRMDALFEIHDERELDRALKLGAGMIGINNRDLRTFETDLDVTLRLAPGIPGDVLAIAESGLASRADLECLAEAGVTTFLIGETLMRQADVVAATRALIGAKMRK